MKKLLVLLISVLFIGCKQNFVGISLTNESNYNVKQAGNAIKAELENAGYTVRLEFADNDEELQKQHLIKMISKKCQLLIVSPINSVSLKDVLENAKELNIPVIAFDRPILNTDAVDYYINFSCASIGSTQARYVCEQLKLDEKTVNNPVYIELFTGSKDDSNVNYYFNGTISVLKPYIDNGIVKIASGENSKALCTTEKWSKDNAYLRMKRLIKEQKYGPKGKRLDAVLAVNDNIAEGVSKALEEAGYTSENFPIVTGLDCDVKAVERIKSGKQSMTLFKDFTVLARRASKMAIDILNKQNTNINDFENFDNNVIVVPTFSCEPIIISRENIEAFF